MVAKFKTKKSISLNFENINSGVATSSGVSNLVCCKKLETSRKLRPTTNQMTPMIATSMELKEKVDTFNEGLFEELVDNVTQQYAKLPNTFGGQS